MKARDPGLRVERALREECDGIALFEGAQDAARIPAALVAIVALDEMVAEPVQQDADQRQAGGFLLDHEAEARRQEGEQERAVDVAGVIRDDDAGPRRQPLETQAKDRQAAEAEVQPGRRRPRRPAATRA